MTELCTPWNFYTYQDGTEDIGEICDADGHAIVTSRSFWMPELDEPIPPTLAALRLMFAAPKMLAALRDAERVLRKILTGELCKESVQAVLARIGETLSEAAGS